MVGMFQVWDYTGEMSTPLTPSLTFVGRSRGYLLLLVSVIFDHIIHSSVSSIITISISFSIPFGINYTVFILVSLSLSFPSLTLRTNLYTFRLKLYEDLRRVLLFYFFLPKKKILLPPKLKKVFSNRLTFDSFFVWFRNIEDRVDTILRQLT